MSLPPTTLCPKAPPGWQCTREDHHDGPCAAVEVSPTFACVVMLPEPPDDASRIDFTSREFTSWDQVPAFMRELEAVHPRWRVVTFCHVEDLPLLMEPSAEMPTHRPEGDTTDGDDA